MASPTILGGVGVAGSLAGSIFGAFGAEEGGKAAAQADQYKAAIAQMNAKIALQNADYARSVGEVQAQQSGMKTRAQVGATVAAQGASGFDVNKGSNVAVRQSETEIGQYEQSVIRSNAAKKAYGYEVEAANDTAQGQLDTMAAAQDTKAGDIGAISSLLGGASSVSSKWLQGKQIGVFS